MRGLSPHFPSGMTLILYEDDANNGHPATENLRVTERLRRKDFGHMSVEVT